MRKPAMIDRAFLERMAQESAPFTEYYGFRVEEFGHGTALVRLPYDIKHTRPGGTIGGPAMMALADFSMWVAVMGAVGEEPLSVTTNLNCNFLRKPAEADLLAEARLLKAGKRLCVGDIAIRADGQAEICAHVTATYSVPPRS